MSATAAVGPFPATGDKVLDAITNGLRWQLGDDRTIDWSISGGFNGETWGAPDQQAAAVTRLTAIFDVFAHYANIRFNYVGAFADPVAANAAGSEINIFGDGADKFFGDDDDDDLITTAQAFYPYTGYDDYVGAPGDVVLNLRSQAATYPYNPGSEGWALLLHEIGHALGLKHPFDDGGTGRPTFEDAGIPKLDVDWATVMSYEDSHEESPASGHPMTPMSLDVLGLIALYGANVAENSGGGTYTLKADGAWVTLLSTGGVDLVSVADEPVAWTIELPTAVLSTAAPVRIGLSAPSAELLYNAPGTIRWLMGNMENVQGSAYGDTVMGNALNNRLNGGGGNDSMSGGAGQDYLRGDDGDDSLTGGADFDDINGNRGNDTAFGGEGDDWVVGGQDQDLLFGDNGFDIVYGNLGNDTVNGGNGADWLRGGQGDDTLDGGAGDDWLWGDRGDDTLSGGAGADLFHTFTGAGVDRVSDFNYGEGDRIIFDDRAVFSIAQQGADTVIVFGADRVILMGVNAANLPSAAILYA